MTNVSAYELNYRTLFVKKLAPQVTDQFLKEYYRQFGNIITFRSKHNFAFVEFETEWQAKDAHEDYWSRWNYPNPFLVEKIHIEYAEIRDKKPQTHSDLAREKKKKKTHSDLSHHGSGDEKPSYRPVNKSPRYDN